MSSTAAAYITGDGMPSLPSGNDTASRLYRARTDLAFAIRAIDCAGARQLIERALVELDAVKAAMGGSTDVH